MSTADGEAFACGIISRGDRFGQSLILVLQINPHGPTAG
jgi:hypothetical protein